VAATRALGERGVVGLGGAQAGDDGVGMASQQRASLGELDRALAARAFDQALPDDGLQGGDLVTDGRLRVAEAFGGAAEGARLGDGIRPSLEPSRGLIMQSILFLIIYLR
jgi:hypothetical protein